MAVALSDEQRKLLEHAVGAGPGTKKKNHGLRNRFCAAAGDSDWNYFVQNGLAVAGRVINDGTHQMFSVTAEGCRAIGIGPTAVKRALAD